ncbi:MAG: STAS domain-containing protein [Thiopseudomonas sp.]|uniref:STAS domain-containing protein n=1 Tax=Denitrificimonas caeni TaxID=521720 RepID=UPI0003B62DA2|nr:STAS domain-containing protein [Denitrificimonas caeni]MBP7189555.1 STAS domain-containing protein [Thiopseudomonas sp.]MBP8007822.1 STAS domain-containing protein [Thiopseudomonas sp.]MBP9614000.1 STAS domain-containing protein [Thiopseudomonas sp.]HHX06665.1 STAS domain-containing protein [Pseudomonas sp.]
MSNDSVTLEDGVLRIQGVLDYRSGPLLRKQGQELIRSSKADNLEVNCAAVEKSSSVGLALLLAFMRDAEQGGKTVKLTHLPLDMQKIAEVCGLTEILNIAP